MKKFLVSYLFIMSTFILLLSYAGCSGGTETPDASTEKGSIYVKGLFDLTGATSDVGNSYHKGILDSIREVNSKGGIKGYKIEIEWKDYAYKADKAVAFYDEWKKDSAKWSKVVSIFGWGTGDSVSLSPTVAKDKIPYISASYAGSLGSPKPVTKSVDLPDGKKHEVATKGAPYNFFAGADYSTSIRLAMQFIKNSGGKKVIFAYCSVGYCTDPIPAGKTYAKKLGLEIAEDLKVELSYSGKDTKEELTKAVEAYLAKNSFKEDDKVWVWSGNTIKTAVFTVQALAKSDKAPKNIKIISNVWGFDETATKRCKDGWSGKDNPCTDRFFGIMPFASFGDLAFPGMKDLMVLHKKSRELDKEDKGLYADVRYVQGYVSFYIWRKAVEKLIDEKKEITGPNIKEAFESFTKLSTGGLTFPLSFSASDHRPSSGTLIYSVKSDEKLDYKGEESIKLSEDWKGW